MAVVRWIGVSGVLVNCFANRSADRVNYDPVLTRGDMPDKLVEICLISCVQIPSRLPSPTTPMTSRHLPEAF